MAPVRCSASAAVAAVAARPRKNLEDSSFRRFSTDCPRATYGANISFPARTPRSVTKPTRRAVRVSLPSEVSRKETKGFCQRETGLWHAIHKCPISLSGGQQQGRNRGRGSEKGTEDLVRAFGGVT